MAPYVEFPRVVYGPDGKHFTIESEAERPDGYTDSPDDAPVVAQRKRRTKAEIEADKADAELAAASRAFLDEHNVEYAADADAEVIASLVEQLEEHLTAVAKERTLNDASE